MAKEKKEKKSSVTKKKMEALVQETMDGLETRFLADVYSRAQQMEFFELLSTEAGARQSDIEDELAGFDNDEDDEADTDTE